MRLRDHPFQLSYGPSDDRLHAFYIPALSASALLVKKPAIRS